MEEGKITSWSRADNSPDLNNIKKDASKFLMKHKKNN